MFERDMLTALARTWNTRGPSKPRANAAAEEADLEELGFGGHAWDGGGACAVGDDLRLRNEYVHQISAREQVKQEVQMVLVLERCILHSEWGT